MTDQDREDAEQFARSYPDVGELTAVLHARRFGRFEGYDAACEAKRIQLNSFKNVASAAATVMQNQSNQIAAERARSAKLANACKAAYLSSDPVRQYTLLSQAIAEYEATND